jgi:hypothetical protein
MIHGVDVHSPFVWSSSQQSVEELLMDLVSVVDMSSPYNPNKQVLLPN